MNGRGATIRRFVAAIALLLVIGFSTAAFADVRVVVQSDGVEQHMLFKAGVARTDIAELGWILLNCGEDQLTIIGRNRYWEGPAGELFDAVFGMTGQAFDELDEDVDVAGLLGALFGSSEEANAPEVKISEVGTETIAGFAATQYRIETGSQSSWETYQDLWLSPGLNDIVQAEGMDCLHLMLDFDEAMAELTPFLPDSVKAVLADESYRALRLEGYPVRTETIMSVFGMQIETVSEVVAVEQEPLPDELFAVPAGYERVDDPSELLFDI